MGVQTESRRKKGTPTLDVGPDTGYLDQSLEGTLTNRSGPYKDRLQRVLRSKTSLDSGVLRFWFLKSGRGMTRTSECIRSLNSFRGIACLVLLPSLLSKNPL